MKHIKIFENFQGESLSTKVKRELIEKNLVKEKDIHIDGDDEITIYNIVVDPSCESNHMQFGDFKWFFDNHAVLHLDEIDGEIEIEFELIDHDDDIDREEINDVVDYIDSVWGKYFDILI